MRTIRDHGSIDLFDPWAHLGEKRLGMLKKSWAGVFRGHVFKKLPVAAIAPHLHATEGRPSKDLYAVLGALVLQQLHDLTDPQTVEAMAFNLSWHYALDIRDERDLYLCERTLRNYRSLLIELNLDTVLFESITDGLIKTYGVATQKQRIDSTRVCSNMRSLTRLGVVVEAIGKFLRELKRRHRKLYAQVEPSLIERYLGCAAGEFGYAQPSEARRQLGGAAADLWSLKVQFAASAAAALESYAILARVFEEQCEAPPVAGAPVRVREPKDVPTDAVLNPADPDACYKTPKGAGYGVQVMETFEEDEPARPSDPAHVQEEADAESKKEKAPPRRLNLITHVEIHPFNEHDGEHLVPALARTAGRGVGPRVAVGDTHYGADELVARAARDGVEVVAPAQPVRKTGGDRRRLSLEDFELDRQGRVVCCPAGHTPRSTRMAAGSVMAVLDQALCGACGLKDLCCVKLYRRFRHYRMQYPHKRVRMRERRLHEQTETFKSRYRWRAGVEAVMSHLKRHMGLDRLRVRGMKAMRYAVNLRALGLNIHRCAARDAVCGS